MPNTFVIKFEDEYVRMTEEQIPQIKSALEKANVPWRRIRTRVISQSLLIGISGELGLGLPHGVTIEEMERGIEVLQDIYIPMARNLGEMTERSERFLRRQMTEQEVHEYVGDTRYAQELEKIRKASEHGRNVKTLWKDPESHQSNREMEP